MSVWGRVAAGVGSAAVNITNKYIDEELSQQRAQFMSDLRVKETKALDDYQMSEGRVARQREIEAGNSNAKFETERGQKLRSATDNELRAAEAAAKDATARAVNKTNTDIAVENANDPRIAAAKQKGALADAETQRLVTIANGSDKQFLSAMRTIEATDPKTAAQIATQRAHQALPPAQTEGVKLSNDDKRNIQSLQKDMADVLSDPSLSKEERDKRLVSVNARLMAYGGAKPADGEKFERTTESVDEKGNKTTEKVTGTRAPRDPNASPYPDGSELTGSDGKLYVVQGGKPVLKGSTTGGPPAAPARQAAPAHSIADVALADTRPPADEFQQRALEKLNPLADDLRAAKARLSAASKSGDPAALRLYAQEVQGLQSKLEAEANKTLGNSAQRFLADLAR